MTSRQIGWAACVMDDAGESDSGGPQTICGARHRTDVFRFRQDAEGAMDAAKNDAWRLAGDVPDDEDAARRAREIQTMVVVRVWGDLTVTTMEKSTERKKFTCARCGWEWLSKRSRHRRADGPSICPHCRSRTWRGNL